MPVRPASEGGGTVDGVGFEGQTRTAHEEQAGDETQMLIQEVLRRDYFGLC